MVTGNFIEQEVFRSKDNKSGLRSVEQSEMSAVTSYQEQKQVTDSTILKSDSFDDQHS